jgi:DNA repair protein RadC
MQVFRIAIQKGAIKVILAHNHPSGLLVPSPADRDLTDRMVQVGKIIHIEVSDHLIFTLDGFYAFSRKGLMAEIRGSKKYVPLYKEKESIRKEALRIGKKEGLKEGKKLGIEKGIEKVAKKMKKKGTAIEFISEITGLSKKDIEKL